MSHRIVYRDALMTTQLNRGLPPGIRIEVDCWDETGRKRGYRITATRSLETELPLTDPDDLFSGRLARSLAAARAKLIKEITT